MNDTVYVRPLTYSVCAIPETNTDAIYFRLLVRYCGQGTWCVQDGYNRYVDEHGDRRLGIKHRHCLSFDEAMNRAKTLAPKVTVNDFSVTDVLAADRAPRTS